MSIEGYRDRDGNPFESEEAYRNYTRANRVASTLVNDYRVSTIWSPSDLDSSIAQGHYHFETLVFGPGGADGPLVHRSIYRTELDAVRGHVKIVGQVERGDYPAEECDDVIPEGVL